MVIVNSATAPTERELNPAGAIQRSAADRFMRWLLRVRAIEQTPLINREAHRHFRAALVVSGVRCLITYLLIPILVPIVGMACVCVMLAVALAADIARIAGMA